MLDDLNRQLKPYGLWFPVDVSTASRATIGGMTANNSCGGRSLRYGTMRDNVRSIDAVLADGTKAHFGPVTAGLSNLPRRLAAAPARARICSTSACARPTRSRARFPKVQRRVGGYNLDAFAAERAAAQSRAHPARLGRHARVLDPHRAEALAAARHARGRRLPFRLVLRGDERRAAPGQAQADRGRAGRPHHAGARAARSRCSARP